MELVPKVGIDTIYLGMSMNEVRSVWGDPDDIKTFIPLEEDPATRDLDWIYKSGYELSFDSSENFLLTTITCVDEEATLEEFKFIGITPKELQLRFPLVEYDDEHQLAINEYTYDKLNLIFYAQENRIYAVTLFPEYASNNNDVLWPIRE